MSSWLDDEQERLNKQNTMTADNFEQKPDDHSISNAPSNMPQSSANYMPKQSNPGEAVGKLSAVTGAALETTPATAPWGAAVQVAGMFLSNLMSQQFQEAQNKKKMAVEFALKGGRDQEASSKQMIDIYKEI